MNNHMLRDHQHSFLYRFACVFCSLIILTGCIQTASLPPVPPDSSDWLIITTFPTADPAAEDVIEALETQRGSICQQLRIDCDFPVNIEVFSSQTGFDDHIMNPAYRGYYALSGEGKIQMVSPSVPVVGIDIPYDARVQIAVHEFVHLALDQIDPNLPDWLDEGTAIYLVPHEIYDQACWQIYPFPELPPVQDLIQAYDSVHGADLYAYTLVRFIAERDGLETLNGLLRSQAKRDEYIRAFAGGLDTEWRAFLEQTYSTATGKPLETEQDKQAQPPVDHPFTAAFVPQPCWFEIPEGASVTCGTVAVLEDRARAVMPGNTIRLAVAVFHATTASPMPDPVVYHIGGPGGHMLGLIPHIYERVIQPFLATRDLILFDQRGTGFSQPALECRQGEAPGDCVRRLFAEGRNLYAYSSVNMAEDMQAIRAALGYDQWNLLGESYGTHVAQVTLKEAPEGLRSVIIDSVMAIVIPELPGGQSSFDVALERLFKDCEQDPVCNAAYPNLPDALQKATQRLDQEPVKLQTNCYGKDKSALMNGERLSSMLVEALYEAELIPYIPYAISAAADGSDYSFWNHVVCWEAMIDDLLSDGAHWAIQCSDGRLSGACEDWPVAVEHRPVASDIPVLILSGEYDPVTPIEYAHAVAENLPNSYVVDFPGMGHWVNGTGHACQSAIIQAFLKNPTQAPDTACVKGLETHFFVNP